MLNLKQERLFVCTLIAVLLLVASAASVANARDVPPTSPPTPVEESPATADPPTLIMTLEGNVTAPTGQGDQPNLYQAQDGSSNVDNSTLVIAPYDNATGTEQDNLIAPHTSPSPDYSVLMAACLSLLVAAVAVSVLIFVRRRKTD